MRRRKLNSRLLSGILAALAVFALGVHLAHGWQATRHAHTLLARARQAEAAGDWDRAATCWQRYLLFAPEDTDALEQYGRLLERRAETPHEHGRAAAVYQQVLARDPGRQEVRRRLAVQELRLGLFEEGRADIELLLRERPDQGDLEALLGVCFEVAGEPHRAAAAYDQALRHDPGQRDVSLRLARLLHEKLNDPRKAGRVLEQMVEAQAGSAEAYLDRAVFRGEHGAAEEAADDVARARQQAPDDLRVLLAAADLAARRGRTDEARRCLLRLRGREPRNVSAHLALASLEAGVGRLQEAADCLRQGLEAVPGDPDLLALLAEVLIERDDLAVAADVIARLRQPGFPPGLADYLDGRLLLHRRDWDRALDALDAVVQLGESAPALAARAGVAAAECYERQGDTGRRLAAAERAVTLDPSSGPARLALAAALEQAGRSDEALEQCRQATLLPHPPDEAWVVLARGLVQRNLSLPAHKRDWEEVARVLDRAAGAPSQAVPAAVARAELLMAQDDPGQARRVLEGARDRQPDQPALWTALAALAIRGGDSAGAARVLADARERLGDRLELRLAEAELALSRSGREAVASLRALEQGLEGVPAEYRERFLCRLAGVWFALGEAREGERVCRQLAARPAAGLASRLLLLDLVLQGGDDALKAGVVAEVRRLEGEEGVWWRYGEAARLLARGAADPAGRGRVGALLDEVAQRRPDWSRVPLLRAYLADLAGEPGRAVGDYLRAFQLGERQPGVVGRLVRLLADQGRDAEADEVLGRLQQQAVLTGPLARLAAEVAVRLHNPGRAVEMARRGVPPGSRDYRDPLWLGQVLAAAGRRGEAEAALREAVRLAEDLPEPWLALVTHLARGGEPGEAEATLEAMRRKLPAAEVPLALAVAAEAQTRPAEAERHYREALRQRPDDGPVLQRAASFFVRLARPADSMPLLRRLLDPAVAVPDGNRLWARRQLALALAFDGGEDGYGEALALLRADPAPASAAGRRVRDLVEAARPATRADALRRLEAGRRFLPPPADELFRMARAYEAGGDGEREREVLLDVLALDGQNPEYLAHHAGRLLERGKQDEARPWVTRLEKVEPGSPRVRSFRAALAAGRGAGPVPR
jgi:tetratricopeptide (TPR) repeat protein